MKVLLGVISFFLLINTFCQTITSKDSAYAAYLIKEAEIDNINETNSNKINLELDKKQIKKIAKVYLYNTFGFFKISSERPFKIYKTGRYWVLWGSFHKKRRGGVFEIIINGNTGEVVYLGHGK